MADSATRRPAFYPQTEWLRVLPVASRFVFRGPPPAQAAAGTAFGVAFPTVACRAATDGSRSALWLGPDEHLLLAGEGDGSAIAADVARSLGEEAHSLVDVSHRQVALEVHGPHAEWLLASQCPLPLDLAAFPVGMCTRTVFAKVEIVLWRIGAENFHVEVWRSFSRYVVELLSEVAREIQGTPGVAAPLAGPHGAPANRGAV
jgi:sarcosine oxidase subunit gamma